MILDTQQRTRYLASTFNREGTMIHFYEIDGGPQGIFWESHGDEGYLTTYHKTADMIEAAKYLHDSGMAYRLHTQEEYNLRWEIEKTA